MSRTSDNRPGLLQSASVLAGIAAAIAAVVALCLPSIASADYEQVPERFSMNGETQQLTEPLAMAVNAGGAGGVQAGSIYVGGGNSRVARFSPGKEGEEPKFREAWGWGIAEGGPEGFVRCGPAWAEIPAGSRPPNAYASCRPSEQNSAGGEEPGHFSIVTGLAVNPATGDVYVLNSPQLGHHEHHLIEVFTPTGEPVGEGFGDYGRLEPFPSESIAEGPEKLHEHGSRDEASIAVDEAGTVYVSDADFAQAPGTHVARIMSFEPESPGDYEHYAYAGQGKDIVTGYSNYFRRIALVGSDRLAVATKSNQIREYATGGGETPLCSRALTGGEGQALAVNPLTGEVFVLVVGVHAKLRRFGPCNEATGEFAELQSALTPSPEPEGMAALAFNPSLAWGPLRPAGVLYGVEEQVKGTSAGYVFAPAEENLFPLVESESVSATDTSSTTLRAQIDPRNQLTEYSFQYLTEASYEANPPGERFAGAAETPVPPATLDSSHIATAPLTGLTPDTAYRFRVVAQSHCNGAGEAPCVASGEAAAFATYPIAPPGPPDSRAYELVSPAQKQGGEVFPADWRIGSCPGECKPPGAQVFAVFPMQSAPDGDAVSYMGFAFSPEEGATVDNSYISRRTASGWQTTAMSPRRLENASSLAYDESLGQGAITTRGGSSAAATLAEEAPAGYQNLYLQNAGDPAALRPVLTEALFAALAPSGRPYRGPGFLRLRYAGHSADFAAQYFSANDSLTFATPNAPEPPEVNEVEFDLYESRGGELKLINVLPGNTEVAKDATFASGSPDTHGISEDGARVFWEAGGHLYVREDARRTLEVKDAGRFLTATPDGSLALLSDGCLYDLAEEACVADLTEGQGGFKGIAGQDRDLSRIYFVDTAALASAPEAGSCQRNATPQAEKEEKEGMVPPGRGCNLYLYEAGAGTRFIATLPASDGEGEDETLNDWGAEPGGRTAEASPDGRYLAFGSSARLTGYRNAGPCEKNGGTGFVSGPCKEVFLYDSATGGLSCSSCNPSGEAPLGNSTLRRIRRANELAKWLPQPRYLTNQGRLFFDSGDRLSPRDSNGRVEDVYEAEPQGLGSCTRAQGCVTLVSPGSGEVDTNFLAMGGEGGEEGSNVFFTTREELVPTDTDELIDVYDARIGGGFASETETTRPECQGESCQPSPSPPQEVTPASAAFHGAGNLEEGGKPASRCPKGKRRVKARGKTRCVATQKKRPHKRHHHRANADRRAHR